MYMRSRYRCAHGHAYGHKMPQYAWPAAGAVPILHSAADGCPACHVVSACIAAALHQHSSTSAAHMYSRAHSEQQSAAAQQRRRTAPQYSSCSAAALALVLRKTAQQRSSAAAAGLLSCYSAALQSRLSGSCMLCTCASAAAAMLHVLLLCMVW